MQAVADQDAAQHPEAGGARAASGVLARLAAKDEARRAERAARQERAAEDADPREDAGRWLAWFGARRDALAADVSAAAADATAAAAAGASGGAAAGAAAAAPDASAARARLDALLCTAAELEKALADASYYLPSYDVKRAAAALSDARAAAEAARAALAPRRKFAFSRGAAAARAPGASAAAAAAGAAAASTAGPSADAALTPEAPAAVGAQAAAAAAAAAPPTAAASAAAAPPTAAASAAAAAAAPAAQEAAFAWPPPLSPYDAELIAAGRGVTGLTGADVVRTAEQLAGGDFVLHGLTDCRVWLPGSVAALRLAGLRRCAVLAGPVAGAVFADGLEGCALGLASQQVRIHRSTGSDFYLRVGSRPVIEHCSGLRFAPLAAADAAALGLGGGDGGGGSSGAVADGEQRQQQEGAEQQQQEEQGGEEGSTGLWRQVDDFGWIKAGPSPHWAVLPAGERRALGAPPATAAGAAAAAAAGAAAGAGAAAEAAGAQ